MDGYIDYINKIGSTLSNVMCPQQNLKRYDYFQLHKT